MQSLYTLCIQDICEDPKLISSLPNAIKDDLIEELIYKINDYRKQNSILKTDLIKVRKQKNYITTQTHDSPSTTFISSLMILYLVMIILLLWSLFSQLNERINDLSQST